MDVQAGSIGLFVCCFLLVTSSCVWSTHNVVQSCRECLSEMRLTSLILTVKCVEAEFHGWYTLSAEDQRMMITDLGITTIAQKRKFEAPESRIVCSRRRRCSLAPLFDLRNKRVSYLPRTISLRLS